MSIVKKILQQKLKKHDIFNFYNSKTHNLVNNKVKPQQKSLPKKKARFFLKKPRSHKKQNKVVYFEKYIKRIIFASLLKTYQVH